MNTMTMKETLEKMREENVQDYIDVRIEMELFEIDRSIENLKRYIAEMTEYLHRNSRVNYQSF